MGAEKGGQWHPDPFAGRVSALFVVLGASFGGSGIAISADLPEYDILQHGPIVGVSLRP
jgi:hypothetical protein